MTAKLRRIRLVNWRNFKNVDLALRDRMFVVGPNASGKTNLLDAFRFLRDIASPGGSLVRAVEDRRGIAHLRTLHSRKNPAVTVEVTLDLSGDPWTYGLEIVSTGKKKSPIEIQREEVKRGGVIVMQRPNANDRADPQLLTQTHLEQKSQNADFRPIQEALAGIVHIHVVPQVAKNVLRAEELAQRDAPGSDFIEQLARLSPSQQEKKLKRIGNLLRHAVPRFSELRVDRDAGGRPHLEARYEHWRPNAGWQNEQEFSDGTLRLIGVLWAIDGGTAPLLLEEPELSLHADVVRQIPRLLTRAAIRAKRQFIVSTHSEEMLHDAGIAPDEIAILQPTYEETNVIVGTDDPRVRKAAAAGIGLSDVIRSITRPDGIEQLGLPGLA